MEKEMNIILEKKIIELFKFDKINKNEDIEIEFKLKKIINFLNEENNLLTFVEYIKLLEYMKNISYIEKCKILNYKELDININIENDETLRFQYNDENVINNIKKNKQKIINMILNNDFFDDNFYNKKRTIIKKKIKNIIFEEYGFNITKSLEKEIENIPKIMNNKNINIRFKERTELIIEINENYKISIQISKINDEELYELEIEILIKNINKMDELLAMKKFINTIIKIIKYIQNSNLIINGEEIQNLKNVIFPILFNNKKNKNTLPYVNVESLNFNTLLNTIPNNYSVTDKADGERSYLLIMKNNGYIIFNNMKIKKIFSNIKINEMIIIDGEYIYLKEKKTFLFLGFDVIYYKNLINDKNLKNRYEMLINIIKKIFGFDFNYEYHKIENDSKDTIIFYEKKINDYLKKLKNLKINEEKNIIAYKFFIFPNGLKNNEIFLYSKIIYDNYYNKNLVEYELDGMIYTPLELNNKIYKWKPENNNSIDFYIEFEKDYKNNVYCVFNKSKNEKINNYIICNLFVYKSYENKDIPIPFDNECNVVHLYLDKDNIIRDSKGKPIIEKSVVEFCYDKNVINKEERWIPMRTRYDKTSIVKKFNRKFGNNEKIAKLIWDTIDNPIKIEEFYTLSDDTIYRKKISEYIKNNEISQEIKTTKNNYYQITTNIAKNLRSFHNWIKDNLINNYCYGKNILDIGIGKGGDIGKYINSKIKSCVGIDNDYKGLFKLSDCAYNRYINKKTSIPFTFICADAKKKLHYEYQKDNFYDNNNKNNIIKIFGLNEKDEKTLFKNFDVVNCQFAIHYFFIDEKIFENFIYNVNSFITNNGYLIITTMNGDYVYDELEKNDGILKSDIINDGENINFFTILKKYVNKTIYGCRVDVNISIFMTENNYYSEYLIFKKDLIDIMKKNKFFLIENDNFIDIYDKYKSFFENVNYNNNKLYEKIYMFYKENNKSLLNFSKLFTYYVFKKNI